MQKFILKSLLFLLLILSVVILFSVIFKRKYDIKTDYLAALIDKDQTLNSLDSNRLILVGGSNLAFGINSELIEEKLPLKVANLGLHAGLGLAFMVNEVSHQMKKGDVVVLVPEYPLYLNSFAPDIDLIQFANELYPASKEYYQFNPKQALIAKFEKFKKFFDPDVYQIDSVFNRQGFNKYGDNTGHLDKKPLAHLIDRKAIKPIEINSAVTLLNEFTAKCNTIGVKVLIDYPSYPKTEFVGKNKIRINTLDTQLRINLKNVVFLSKPKKYVFDDSLFYDTIYHLGREGREIRTNLFIEDLENYLGNPKKPF